VEDFLRNKKVLLIGGTGTIGKSILQNVLNSSPAVVRVFSRDEYKQFELNNEYKGKDNIRYLIGDVRDQDRVHRAMEGIDYVFHVAAMKHVPSCEYNPYEAVQTNIIGTQNVIQAALYAGVKKVIFTSTDKAIAPTNTYGASKLMAERLIASAQYNSGGHGTIFAAVRFGNVMGSRGSVIPLFRSQIQKAKKVTVTDLQMTRFMMTIDQATKLTVKAMDYAQGGEIFVLKMPVVGLKNLAECLIEQMSVRFGYNISDIDIEMIGLRAGEKVFEELMTIEESKYATELSDMYIIRNAFLSKVPEYAGSKPAPIRGYSSEDEEPVSREQLMRMLEYVAFE
jgi:UDP-N-acetylglucosamine 4,6-dehydratase